MVQGHLFDIKVLDRYLRCTKQVKESWAVLNMHIAKYLTIYRHSPGQFLDKSQIPLLLIAVGTT